MMRSQTRSKRNAAALKSTVKANTVNSNKKSSKGKGSALQGKASVMKNKATAAKKKKASASKKKATAVQVSCRKIKQELQVEEFDELPEALQNVKTEVKVENGEFSPQGECEPLPNMSPLVHAADGRSRHNLVDANNRPFRIPPHLLGRNLSDPTSDTVAGSRRPLQKPRLGVKIPYRNLTSQIITHEELTRELLERSNRNNPVCGNNSGPVDGSKGYIFTMKLMARLAHRMPNCNLSELAKFGSPFGFVPRRTLDPEMEREIALKQLRELPCKRRTREMITEDIDYKRIAIKAKPLTPKQLALKQLKEIQIRKPRSQYVQRDQLADTQQKLPKLNFQLKIEPSSGALKAYKRKVEPVSEKPGASKVQGVVVQRKSCRIRKPNKRY